MKALIVPVISLACLVLWSCTTTVTETTDASGVKTKTSVTSVDPATAAAVATAATNAALDRAEREREKGNVDQRSEK